MNVAVIMTAVSVMALFLCCIPGGLTDGTGEETTNGRAYGKVIDSCERPVKGAAVALLPAHYDPVKDTTAVRVDTTDAAGSFDFSGIDSGLYNVVATYSGRARCAMVSGIGIRRETIVLPSMKLLPPGAVRVMLPLNADPASGYVYIPGTGIVAYLNGGRDWVVLDSVPGGSLPSIAYGESAFFSAVVIRYDVQVDPARTVSVFNPDWLYARRVWLNTSATGADVAGSVTNFPVLIRLTGNNFPFGQARSKGEDIRFGKTDSAFLSYEIKRWDATNRVAEVWVRVDTVYGSDRTQSLTMYWGNPAAADRSDGAAVFDSSSGFEAVWHLGETSGMLARDASHNGFTGTYRGGLPRGGNGPLGIAQTFARPDTDYIDMGNVLNPGTKNLSIGIWLRRGVTGAHQALVAKTNGDSPSASYGYLLNLDASNFPHFYMATGGTSWFGDSIFTFAGNQTITDTAAWHHLFVTIDRSDNALCRMYVDGVDRTGVMGGDITRIASVVNDCKVNLGTESDNNCSFTGSLCEATVSFTVRSADWVKMCYMNQKERDALVEW